MMVWQLPFKIALAVVVIFVSTADVCAADDRIAIDVLIKPDEAMVSEAKQWNALLREQSPEGFSLDERHVSHITLVQLLIDKRDLPAVLSLVNNVKESWNMASLQLTATGLSHMPMAGLGLAGIVIEPTEQLVQLQQDVVTAVQQYSRAQGSESSFVQDAGGLPFEPLILKYVETFISEQAGNHFNPHLTIGLAPLSWLKWKERQPFHSFNFGVRDMAVYQLGNFGAASKRMDKWLVNNG